MALILNVSSQSPSTYQFGVDLSDAVLKEVTFLKEIDKHHALYSGPLLKQAIFRYEKLWLPFAAKHKNQTLAAPLDISWVWHCHMLAPRCYVKDCLNICGVIVDHSLTPTCDKETVQQRWSEAYPDHPYNVDVSNETTYIDVASSISKLGYNLEEAASRQKVFYYQVSLPHYQDTKFIESAIGRYRKFLELKQCYPTFFIVPCYDVDVVWHAHQLHPVTYKEDTKVLLREHFNHDDSVNDRSPGSKLNVSDSETRTIWKKKYGENFASFGAMFRGLPPNGKLHKMSLEKMIIQYPKKVSIVIQQVHVADESVAKKTRSLEFNGILKSGTELKLLKMKKPAIGKGMWNADTHVQEKRELEFDTGICERFTVALYKKGLFGNMGPKNIEGKASLDILRFINKCRAVNVTENQTVELTVGSTNVRIDFDLTIVKYKDISYTFSPGTYEECIMPEFLEDLWGPVPLTRLPKGQDNKCYVASHRLRTTNGTVEFTVRTIHSLPCLMSVVHVFYHDKLSVVCHLIGPDTLPRRDQVTKKTKLTLIPSKGERAVVIKNNDGDWAVLTGNWTGLRKGIPGKPGRRGIPGSPGHLKISLYKMATGKWTRLSLKNWNNTKDFSFTLDGVHVDMNLNLIKCSATEGDDPEVPENLGLALSIVLLHVLCQPRPSDWEARKSLTPAKKATRGGRAIRHLAVEDYGLMLGMGLFVPTPCNHYLRHRYMGVRSHGSYVAGAFREDQSVVMEEALAGYYTEGIHNDTAGDDESAGCGGCGGCGGGGMWGGYGGGGWSGGGDGGSDGDSDDGGGPGYSGGRGGGGGRGDWGSYDSSDDDDYGGGGGDGGGGGGDDGGGGGDSGGGGGSCGGGDRAGDSGGDDGGGDSGGGGFDSGGGGGGGCGGGGCGGGGCGGCGG